MLRRFLSRLLALARRRRYDQELDSELAAHLELAERDAIAAGMSPSEAARQARLRFGGLERIREEHRDSRSLRWVERTARDARHTARSLRRTPGFSSTAVLILAFGIGATTAMFSVVYGSLLKPLPFDEPDRLVATFHLAPGFGMGPTGPLSAATYFTYRDHARVFEDIGLWGAREVTVTRSGTPERVQRLGITDGFLTLLRVRPLLGDLIRKEDDVPGAPNRVVLTYGYWQRAFGAARDVIGQSLAIDGTSYEIIGVLPASFRFLDTDPQLLVPYRLNRATALTGPGFGFNGVARLKPGVSLSQANDDIARMIPLIPEQFPLQTGVTREMWESVGLAPNVRPLSEAVIGNHGRPLWILLGAVSIVLFMAWTNVASLLLVRVEGRQREFAVRGALGASRGRMAAELLSESLMLGLAGGTLGILFARACIGLLRWMAPAQVPRVDEIAIDGVVLFFTLTISLVTALIFGVLPILKLGTLNFAVLKDAGRSSSDAPGRHRTRNTLVVAQIALALVLLIVSGLMIRTSFAMLEVEPGFVRPADVQTFRVALPAALISDQQQVARTYEEITERLKQVPGVVALGLTDSITLEGDTGTAPFYVEDRSPSAPHEVTSIGPGYFETMGNPIVAGRAISWTDIFELQEVAVISENLAREYWGEPSEALGKRIGGSPKGPWTEIVGVVGNERANGLSRPAPTLVYRPLAHRFGFERKNLFVSRNMAYVVRSGRVGAPGFLRELEQAVWSVNPNVPLADVRTLEEIQAKSMSGTSFAMVMLGIAASGALLLALVGIYGVVSYVVAERTHEIGIRMTLGAQSGDVRGLFLRHGLALTLTGILLGIGAAVLVTPAISTLLYGVAPTDPVTYAAVAIALSATTLLATYLPARRASRVQPIVALRSQ